MDAIARLIQRSIAEDTRTVEQRYIALTGVDVSHYKGITTVRLHGPARIVDGNLWRLTTQWAVPRFAIEQAVDARGMALLEITRGALEVGLPDGPFLDVIADAVLSGATGGVDVPNGPTGE